MPVLSGDARSRAIRRPDRRDVTVLILMVLAMATGGAAHAIGGPWVVFWFIVAVVIIWYGAVS